MFQPLDGVSKEEATLSMYFFPILRFCFLYFYRISKKYCQKLAKIFSDERVDFIQCYIY